ncbi:MAG: PH domain-containing protein [Casimicrobiaceae bacterium]
MTAPPGTHKARFNPLIRPYLVFTIGFTLMMTIIGIPLAIIWFLGVGQWWARHYFDKLECELNDRVLRYRKGILVQVEKTIPLENIQDVTFLEGPLLKRFQLSTLRFETAGQGSSRGNDLKLTGIIDAHEFRNMIMEAREALRRPPATAQAESNATQIQSEQLAALRAIGAKLGEIATLLRDRQ